MITYTIHLSNTNTENIEFDLLYAMRNLKFNPELDNLPAGVKMNKIIAQDGLKVNFISYIELLYESLNSPFVAQAISTNNEWLKFYVHDAGGIKHECEPKLTKNGKIRTPDDKWNGDYNIADTADYFKIDGYTIISVNMPPISDIAIIIAKLEKFLNSKKS